MTFRKQHLAYIRYIAILLPLLLFCPFTAQGEINLTFPDGKKAVWLPGETIQVKISLKCLPETCVEGMKQTKLYVSGLKIVHQDDWEQTGKGLFEKEIQLLLGANFKGKARFTVKRKTDKENLFRQETFTILTQ